MGIKVMTKVWEWSKSSGNDRMVLLALADHADDDGVCFPGIPRIAKKSRISERTVQRCFKNLQKIGELRVEEGMGMAANGGKTNRYTIRVTGGDSLTGGDKSSAKVVTKSSEGGDTVMSPEPAVESSKESSLGFDAFWKSYPRKENKGGAERAWKKIKPDQISAIIIALEIHTRLDKWKEDNGAFIPHPATWLNGKRWEDDMQGQKVVAKEKHTVSLDSVWADSIWLLCDERKRGEEHDIDYVEKKFKAALRYAKWNVISEYIVQELGKVPAHWFLMLDPGEGKA